MTAIRLLADTDFPGYVDRRLIQSKDFVVDFSDLGAGASDSILLSATAFEGSLPTNFVFIGVGIIANPEFTGEADLTVALGLEGGDTDGYLTATALHETGDNVPIEAAGGALMATHQGRTHADMADWALLFAATELNDVSAGSLTCRVFYLNAFPQ
jgi:hypothetical protein